MSSNRIALPFVRMLASCAVALATAAAWSQDARIEPQAIDARVLARASELVYSKELTRARLAKALNAKPELQARARRNIEPLTSYASDIVPAAAEWTWVVNVEVRPDAMAICLPTGKNLVSSGLVERTQLSDDELSAIMAHVIAHTLIGHDANEAVALYRKREGRTTPDPDVNRAALQLSEALGGIMMTPHYSAAAEKVADEVGMELLARAGIPPGSAPSAWRKIAAAGGNAPDVAALHPPSAERIAAIEALVPTVMPLYQKAITARPPQPRSAPPMPRR